MSWREIIKEGKGKNWKMSGGKSGSERKSGITTPQIAFDKLMKQVVPPLPFSAVATVT
jgi:hypothetical protein